MSITETVLEYQPDKLQLLQWTALSSGRARWEFTAEGDGTRLTTTFDYALPGGVLGKIADALIVKRMKCQESRRSSRQLQSARRTTVGCCVMGEAGSSMRKLIYSMTVSLDGYDRWAVRDRSVPDEELFRFHTQQVQEVGAYLRSGAIRNDGLLGDRRGESAGRGAGRVPLQIWKALPKVVFSTTLESVVGNTTLARDGLSEEVSRLKEQPGKDIAVGGAGLARACRWR